MKILHRYIVKTVISSTFLVLLVVSGLIFLFNFLAELRDIGQGDYGIMQACWHVLLQLPHNVYLFFPMLVLLGGAIGLGVLATHQELTIMRAAGFSLGRITGGVMMAALILIFLATLIGEGIGPRGNYLGNLSKDIAQNGGQAVATSSGVWVHEGMNFLHIQTILGVNHLDGVTRYQFDDQHHLLAAYFAKSADYKNKQWQLKDLVKTTFVKGKTHSDFVAAGTWDLNFNPTLLNVGLIEPDEMSLKALLLSSRHLKKNGLQAGNFQLEFWKRVFQPFSTMVMILLAIPFVFRVSRSVSMGWRVLFGISIGFTFYILNAFIGEFSLVYQLSPFFAAVFPTLLFAIMGVIFMVRAKN